MSAKLRPGAPADARTLAAITLESVAATHQGILPADYLASLSVDAYEQTWRHRFETMPSLDVWIAQAGSEAEGFGATQLSDDHDAQPTTGHLAFLFVMPDAIGTGVGKGLLERCVESMRARGYLEATLWVFEKNNRARRFYEMLGWTFDGARAEKPRGGAMVPQLRYNRAL